MTLATTAKRTAAKRTALAVMLASSVLLTGCYDGRPGHNSDRHHGRHHDGDHHDGDHDHHD